MLSREIQPRSNYKPITKVLTRHWEQEKTKKCEVDVETPTYFDYATGFRYNVVYLAFVVPHFSHIHPFIKMNVLFLFIYFFSRLWSGLFLSSLYHPKWEVSFGQYEGNYPSTRIVKVAKSTKIK